ncbi:uncharacterized protein PV09_08268 [Verruconis gallopava]|uniref:Uncharacterized protein n=1 Tax=Verruconis gallopava TaxID=253628 RepID=A0A0D2A1M9_9PEZI|nr:uncharacterized protein PV09_08268 [Verruconis gallopava]KIW00230.1 hypothetical protein PV09_08268 [Verruconis gallopava]
MRPSRAPSEAPSALEDSVYDFVSNTDMSESSMLSDEDAHTESVASFDANTPDDLSVINSAEYSEEEEALNTPLDSILLNSTYSQQLTASVEEQMVDVTPTIGDSGYTAHTVRPEPSSSYLDFFQNDLEPCSPHHLNLVHVVQSADHPNCNGELDIYDAKYVSVEMHMTVTKAPMLPRDSFRVLILGYYTHSNSDIAQHIKAALHSEMPKEDVDNKTSLVMHHCVSSRFGKDRRQVVLTIDHPKHLDVTLCGGKAFLGRDPYKIWDLAIFLHTSLANIPTYEIPKLESTFEIARLGMRASRVPIMDLSMYHPLYRAVPHLYTCEKKSLHLRVSTRRTEKSKEVLCELLPVDLDKFLAIEPHTLARHIACITERGPTRTRAAPTAKRRNSRNIIFSAVHSSIYSSYQATRKLSTTIIGRIRQYLRYSENGHMIELLLGLIIILVAIAFCTQILGFPSKSPSSESVSTLGLKVPNLQDFNWVGTFSQKELLALSKKLSSDNIPPPPAKTAEALGMKNGDDKVSKATRTQVQKHARQENALEMEKRLLRAAQEEWAVDVVDPQTILLYIPRKIFPYMHSCVRVSVHKDGAGLHVSHKTTSSKAIAVVIHEIPAHGDVSVQVRGHYELPQMGRFPFSHSFDVYLGHGNARTSFEAMKDLVAQEFILVQNNAMELSTRMTTGLQQYIDEIHQQTLALQRQAMDRVHETTKSLMNFVPRKDRIIERNSRHEHLNQLRKIKKALRRQGKQLSDQFEAMFRPLQQMARRQCEEFSEIFRLLSYWQHSTAWPVRASDWKPHVAAKRGWSNAKGLLHTLRRGPKLTDDPAREEQVFSRLAKNRESK